MRKHLFAILALALAVAPVAARNDDEANATIEKAIKAQGDIKTAKALMSTFAKGKGMVSINGMEIAFKIERWVVQPAKEKSVLNLTFDGNELAITQVLVDGKGWASVMGQSKELDADEITELKSKLYQEYVTYIFPLLQDKSFKLTSLGDSMVENKKVIGVQVSKKDESDIKLYFDKSTYLLLKTEAKGKSPISKEVVKEETIYKEYKEMVPGLKVASKYVVNHDGQKFMDFEVTELRTIEKQDAKLFTKPD